MQLHPVDTAIIVLYMLGMIVVGFVVERRARAGITQLFPRRQRDAVVGAQHVERGVDVRHLGHDVARVRCCTSTASKSVFIPWLWPVFNQIFLMVYLSAWLRRSGAMTGAEWITLRFGSDTGCGGLADQRRAICAGERDRVHRLRVRRHRKVCGRIFLPATFSPNTYALIIIGVTTLYTVVGGLYSVVVTDMIQFLIMIVCSFALGFIAM